MQVHPIGVFARGKLVKPEAGGLRCHTYYRIGVRAPGNTEVYLNIKATLIQGRYQVTDLHLLAETTDSISSEFLRTIPLRSIVDGYVAAEIRTENVEQMFNLRDPFGEHSDHRLTAFHYRLARLLGEAPTKAVMQEFGVSRSTATRRVAEARRAGFLGADEVGQAGGVRSGRQAE